MLILSNVLEFSKYQTLKNTENIEIQFMYTILFVCIHINDHVLIYVYVHMYFYIYIHIYIYTYIHIIWIVRVLTHRGNCGDATRAAALAALCEHPEDVACENPVDVLRELFEDVPCGSLRPPRFMYSLYIYSISYTDTYI